MSHSHIRPLILTVTTICILSIVITEASATNTRTRTRVSPKATTNTTQQTIQTYGVTDEYRRNQNGPYELTQADYYGNTEGDGNKIFTTSTLDTGNYTHNGDIILNGNLDAGNTEIFGNVMIRGDAVDLGNVTIHGNLYVYGSVLSSGNMTVTGKIKVIGNYDGGNNEASRLYVYGKILSSGNDETSKSPYTGYLKRIDPFLRFDLSASELTEVKHTVSDYESQVWQLKSKLEKEYSDYKSVIRKKGTPKNTQTIKSLKAKILSIKQEMVADEYLSSVREYDVRDINGFKQAQKKEIEDTNNYLNSIKL